MKYLAFFNVNKHSESIAKAMQVPYTKNKFSRGIKFTPPPPQIKSLPYKATQKSSED